VSNQSGQFDLWVQNLENGERIQLTNSVDRESRGSWSHDGTRLAYFRNYSGKDSSGIWSYDFSTGEAQELIRFHEATVDILNKVVWKDDDSAIYFISPHGAYT